METEVDRGAVARYGATEGDLEDVVEVAIGGMDLTTTIEERNRFTVRVRYARELAEYPRVSGPVLGALLVAAALSVYKPRGRTQYRHRKQHEQRKVREA
jgi:Cu/Ag efflux pump CusA